MAKKTAAELRAELRELRKSHADYKPVSKLGVKDISAQIERIRGKREETPAAAATPSSKSKMVKSSVETIKEAKASEFPTYPSSSKAAPQKKKTSKAQLMAMLNEMSSSDEE